MFSIFKKTKSKDVNIYAPVDGLCMDITECVDEVFANKMMGDGFFIKPTSNSIQSVCDGKVEMIFPSKHAIGIKMNNGQEIMLHIGIDTVKLNGKGFKTLVNVNDNVRVGTPLVELDIEYLEKQNVDLSVIVVMTNDINIPYSKEHLGNEVLSKTKIIKRE